MRKVTTVCAAMLLLVALLAGCSASVGKPDDDKLSVYASFYPLYDFAQKVGGDRVAVTNMVPAGAEPHDWEPTAADIADLEQADVFIYNGAGMEHWVESVLGTLQNGNLITVETSHALTLLAGHHHHHEDAETEEPAHDADEGEAYDPHVWLNPLHAKQQMEAIKEALVAADPDNQAYYQDNYARYAAEFDALDQEFRDALADLPQKTIVVTHQAFGYLCAAYGLQQEAISGLSPDSEPDPGRMAEIIAFAREHDVKVIFFEELVSPKVAETIAAAIGADTQVLNPLEGLNDEQQAAGDDYFSVMRQNLQALQAALR